MRNIDLEINDSTIAKRIRGRKAIFLDTNIWIHLADEKNDITNRIRQHLIKLVKEGGAFCPLSAPLLWELYKQSFNSALRVGKLMEELCLNVSYVSVDEIVKKEVENYVFGFIKGEEPKLSYKDIYAPIMAYMSSYYRLSFPESYSENQIGQFCNTFSPIINNITLTGFIKMREKDFPKHFQTKHSFSEQIKNRREFTKGDIEKMRRVEGEYVAQNIIIPLSNKTRSLLPIRLQFSFVEYIASLPKDKYNGAMRAMLKYMPAIDCLIEIMTITGCDINRKDSMNDFIDREIMIIPLAYADAFISQDKWIRHILMNLTDVAKNNNVTYISTLTDFEKYLMDIEYGMA